MAKLPLKRKWAEAEDALLFELIEKKTSMASSAIRLKRSQGSVAARARKLGLVIPIPARGPRSERI